MARRAHRPRRDRRSATATVVDPPWVHDPSKWPFGPVILDTPIIAPNRIFLTVSQLAEQLKCSQHLVRTMLKVRDIHLASSGEVRAEIGLCAEDLASTAIGVLLIKKYNFGLDNRVRALMKEVCRHLLHHPIPQRVILALFTAKDGVVARILVCEGNIPKSDIPAVQLPYVKFYDCSDLREKMDTAIATTPLALPMARSVSK